MGKRGPKGAISSSFKVGNPGGPGRRALTIDQREAWDRIKHMQIKYNVEFHEKLEFYREKSEIQLKEIRQDPNLPSDDKNIIDAFLNGKTDFSTLTVMKALMCGPEPRQVELSGKDGEPLNPLSKFATDELIEAVRTLRKGENPE